MIQRKKQKRGYEVKKLSSVLFLILFFLSCFCYQTPVLANPNEEIIDFGVILKGNVASKKFSFKSSDSNTVNIECVASSSYHWISIDPDHFILEPGEAIHIEVSISTISLKTGKYVGEFFIYATADPSQISYKVLVEVIEKTPKLKVDEQPIEIITMKKNESITRTVLIENIGGDTLFVNFKCNENWIELDPLELTIFENQHAFLSMKINIQELDRGFFSSKVYIQSNGGNASISISVRIQEETPYLFINQSIIDLGEIDPGFIIKTDVIITNKGSGILEGTLNTNHDNILISDTLFSLYANQTKKITIEIDQTKENKNQQYFSYTIIVKSNGGDEKVVILFKIKKKLPKLSINKLIFDLGEIKNKELIKKSVTILNEGQGILEGQIMCSCDWINIDKHSFSLNNEESIEVNLVFNPEKMKLGKLEEKIQINTNIENKDIVIYAYRVKFPPIMILDKQFVDFGFVELGDIVSNNLLISNIGEEELDIDIVCDCPFIILSLQNSIIYQYQVIEIIITTIPSASLEAGLKNCTISIKSKLGIVELPVKIDFIKKSTVIILTIGNYIAFVNNQPIKMDVPAQIINNRTYVPLRFIGDAIGAKINWIPYPTNEIQIQYKEKLIHLWINSSQMVIEYAPELKKEPEKKEIDSVPLIQKNRTLVPIRFITETFGSLVEWEAKTQTIKISF